MSNNFEHKPLSQLCTLLNGLAFKPEDWSEYGHPIIRIQNLNGSSDFNFCNRSVPNEYKILPDTVLFSWSGNRGTSFGPYWWKGPHGVLNQHIFKITAKSGIYPRWLYYGLDFARQKAEQEAHGGSGLVHVRRTDLLAYQIPTPPLPEQRRIAKILDTIDEAIQKTEELISKLKAMKQGLLHDLLTCGLEKNGKLRDPKTHPEQFKDSPLGKIPKEWVIHSLEDFSKYISYGFTNPMPSTAEGPWMITAFDIGDGRIKYEQARHTSIYAFHHQLTQKSKPCKGDILITKDGTLGRVAVVDSKHLCINQSVACIQPLPNTDIFFLFHYLQSPNTQKGMLADAGGSTIKHIYVSKLRNLEVVYPKKKERGKIVEIIKSHDARIRTEEQCRDKLKLQKRGLMHDLLTGKVRVKG